MASRWSDIFERELEREPELGPSNEPGPQPDSWFADKVEDVPPMQATQAPQPEAEFQDGIEVEEEVILCAGLLPGAQIAERVGRALALLARTKVRSPARPRARHLAPCPAPRSPRPRAPHSALARRSRYSPCPPAPLAGARRPRPQAPRMRGAGGARARASQAGWCLCAASVRRVRVLLCEFTNPHTNTQARAAENALELAGLGLSPPSLHSGQVRRARARRASAQLQASCPPSAGQEPSPPLEQKAPAV